MLFVTSSGCWAQDWTFFAFFQSCRKREASVKNFSIISTYRQQSIRLLEQKEYPATVLQYYLQPSLTYKITPNVQFGMGYAYVKHNLFGLHVNENLLWGQFVATHNLPLLERSKILHRLRYEERYPLNMRIDQWSYATLFRYQLGINWFMYDPVQQKKVSTRRRQTNFFFV